MRGRAVGKRIGPSGNSASRSAGSCGSGGIVTGRSVGKPVAVQFRGKNMEKAKYTGRWVIFNKVAVKLEYELLQSLSRKASALHVPYSIIPRPVCWFGHSLPRKWNLKCVFFSLSRSLLTVLNLSAPAMTLIIHQSPIGRPRRNAGVRSVSSG